MTTTKLTELQTILDNNKTDMKEGVYIKLCEKTKELYKEEEKTFYYKVKVFNTIVEMTVAEENRIVASSSNSITEHILMLEDEDEIALMYDEIRTDGIAEPQYEIHCELLKLRTKKLYKTLKFKCECSSCINGDCGCGNCEGDPHKVRIKTVQSASYHILGISSL